MRNPYVSEYGCAPVLVAVTSFADPNVEKGAINFAPMSFEIRPS